METVSDIKDNSGFVAHMTQFDDATKSNIMNVLQYSLLCVVPILMFKKLVSPLFPEVDETKGSLEISIEVILQICSIFVGLFLIHRLVTFVQPYSGKNYPEVNLVNIALTLLFILMSFETQIAEKVDILVERLVVLWNGDSAQKQDDGDRKERVRVSQPIAGNQPAPQHQNSRADYLATHGMMTQPQQQMTTSIDSLPNYGASQQAPPSVPQMQQQPNFDQMYAEPMAANEGFGGFSKF